MIPAIRFKFIKPLNVTLVGLYDGDLFDIVGSVDGRLTTEGIRQIINDFVTRAGGVHVKDFRI